MPFASFAKVLPVHGAIIRISKRLCGPIGSASVTVDIIGFLQISEIRVRNPSAVPKRVSVEYAVWLIIGVISAHSFDRPSSSDITFLKVQNEPVIAKPIRLFSKFKCYTPISCKMLMTVSFMIFPDVMGATFPGGIVIS